MNMKQILIISLSLVLSACGGGGSSSGGNDAEKIVTDCIDAQSQPSSLPEFSSTDYTNTCDFTVSLGYKFLLSIQGPVTLVPNQTVSKAYGSTSEYIACRPPSQATNKGDTINPELGCT